MDTASLVPLLELLDDNIDDLEKALQPLLRSPLIDNTGKLPLLDKAQLYVLVTYAIESLLFCQSKSQVKVLLADSRSTPSTEWHQCERSSSVS